MVHDRDRSLKVRTARYAADFVHLGFEADAPGGPLHPDLPDRKQPALERDADFVVRVEWHGQPVLLLLVEFETCWKPNVPERIAEYALRLHLRYGLPVQATVVVLRPGGKLRDCWEMGPGPEPTLRCRFRVVRLWGIEAQA